MRENFTIFLYGQYIVGNICSLAFLLAINVQSKIIGKNNWLVQ